MQFVCYALKLQGALNQHWPRVSWKKGGGSKSAFFLFFLLDTLSGWIHDSRSVQQTYLGGLTNAHLN